MKTNLKIEEEYFSAHHEMWNRESPNSIALIKGERLVGLFESEEEAGVQFDLGKQANWLILQLNLAIRHTQAD